MESFDALLQSKVRVDTATNKGSVIGLLKVLTGFASRNCSVVLQRIQANFPELATNCSHVKINGKGRETPVADAATLVEIVFVVRSCHVLLETQKELPSKSMRMTSLDLWRRFIFCDCERYRQESIRSVRHCRKSRRCEMYHHITNHH